MEILEIWRTLFGDFMVGDLEKLFGDLEKSFGNLEKTYLAIFGENVLAICRNRSVILERTVRRYWREPFGNNVGDLERRGRRGYGDFVLEFVISSIELSDRK